MECSSPHARFTTSYMNTLCFMSFPKKNMMIIMKFSFTEYWHGPTVSFLINLYCRRSIECIGREDEVVCRLYAISTFDINSLNPRYPIVLITKHLFSIGILEIFWFKVLFCEIATGWSTHVFILISMTLCILSLLLLICRLSCRRFWFLLMQGVY